MSLEKADLVALRPMKVEDRNFILATWLRGLFYGSSFFQEIPKDVFMRNYHDIIEKIISSPRAIVTVACLKDDADTILGYSVRHKAAGAEVLDWVFVKSAWRRIGIAKSLLPVKPDACTHLTKVGKILMPTTCVFNPFI